MLQKQAVNINFGRGLDTKTDSKQVQLGNFLSLQNSIFNKGGLLTKRNGFDLLPALPNTTYSYLTTFNDNLTAINNNIAALSVGDSSWISKGSYAPMKVSTLPLIRNNINQIQADSVIASNDLICTVYTEINNTIRDYKYVIANSTTGQNIVAPTLIPVIAGGTISGSSRVFIVGNYFVIVSQVLVSGSSFLQYFSIPINNVINRSAAQKVTSEVYVPISSNPGWDGVAVNNSSNNVLVIAYNSTTTAQGVHVTTLTQVQIASASTSSLIHQFNGSTFIGAIVSVCVDLTVSPNVFYISFWNNSTTNGYACAVTIGFGTITSQFTPQLVIPAVGISNIATAAQNGSLSVFYEVVQTYNYDNAIPTNAINALSVSSAGVVGGTINAVRSVGLASKAFIIDGTVYFLAAYQSPFQPTYFLINGSLSTEISPVVVAKLAYENGGGYVALGLPGVTVDGSTVQIPYLYKDFIQALTVQQNTQQTTIGGIYSQTGINLAAFDLTSGGINTVEIGNNLNIGGGFGWMYDGYLPVEQNFFLWPDSVECTYTETSTVNPTGIALINSNTVAVSSATGIVVGMTISDSTNSTYIPAGTTVIAISGTTVTMSANTIHAFSGDTLVIQGNIVAQPDGSTNTDAYYYQAIYSWTDNQGNIFRSAGSIPVSVTTMGSGSVGTVAVNIPTLRLTYKTANPVAIQLFRWSAQNQEYHQVFNTTVSGTPIPILNNLTSDFVTFIDTLPDSEIQGNSSIYTTGGVVEDVNPPASNIMTLFDTRAWLVDAEDPNLLWFSKQVIEATPVEWSDLFTFYVAPTTGAQGSTGAITALAPMDDKLIIFKPNAIYYINGIGPDNTGANNQYSQPIFITSTVGCANPNSIVLTPAGLMFQSNKGIWLLGRDLSTQYIGAPVEAFNSSVVLSANTIPGTNQVRFTLDTPQTLMYDYYYGQWGTFVGIPGISSCIYNDLHTFINQYGQVYQESPGSYSDGSNPVLLSFQTGWINIAGLSGYERIYDFILLANYVSPHFLQVQVAYDYAPSATQQTLITPNNYTGVYGSDQLYGQTTPYGGPGSLEQWRIHTQRQTCQAFQIAIQEVFNPSFNNTAGAGFTMSGVNCTIGVKKGRRPIPASNSAG